MATTNTYKRQWIMNSDNEYVDPYKEGIIEPTLVQTEAISNSVSIAGVMLATSGANIKVDDDKEAPTY